MGTQRSLTDANMQYIQDNALNKTVAEIAEYLGRAYCTIRDYCITNKIEVKKNKQCLTIEEITFIFKNRTQMTITELARNLDRHVTTLHKYL